MEGGFPRGGKKTGGTGTSGGDNQIARDKRKKGPRPTDDEKAASFKADKKLELPAISYDTLVEGTLCLGCVRRVHESNILVGLPGMTVGTVDIKSISTPYTLALEKLEKDQLDDDEVIYPLDTMFKPGDIVVVKVMGVVLKESGKHHVTLSLDPNDVHSDWMATDLTEDIVMTGAVRSKEDKGYIMDLGIKGVNAFLPINFAVMTEKKFKRPFGIGQLLSVNITNCQIKRLMARVTLNSVPMKVKQVCPPEGGGVKLLPGMRTSCIVVEKRPAGLMVSFMDTIGRVHNDHLAERYRADVSDTVYGRILFIPPWDVGPYLTLDDVSSFPYAGESREGNQLTLNQGEARRRKGVVTSLDPRGAKVKFGGGGCGLLKRQRATDKLDYTDEQFKKDFRVRSEHEFRILEFSPLDNLFILSCQEHYMDPTSVITKEELILGSSHNVSVVSYNQGGAIVKIGDIKGFLPFIHFKDKAISSQTIQKKFPPGTKISARVFQIDISRNSAVFTGKKTLRQSTGLIASSYGEISVGELGHGIVRFIAPDDKGLRIQMLGGLFGFAPKGKIPKGPDVNLSLLERYPIGMPVEFKIVEVNVESGRAILSLDTRALEEGKEKKSNKRPLPNESKKELPKRKKTRSDQSQKGNSSSEEMPEEEIPMLVPIPKKDKQKKRHKKVLEDFTEMKVSEEEGEELQPPTKRSKLSKKEKKRKLEAQSMSRQSDGQHKPHNPTKRDSEDSGIEDETSALKLATKSFWDVGPSSGLNEAHNSNQSDDDLESIDADVKVEVEVEGRVKGQKRTKETSKTLIEKKNDHSENLKTEKEHEFHLIQNSSDGKAWKAFKEFVLKCGSPAKAVSLVKQMKDKIPFRDEKGKLNCWLTILQIENQFGSEASVKSTIDEAMKVTDPIVFLDRAAQYFQSIDKTNEAEELYRRRLKMKLREPDSWLNLGLFLYTTQKFEAARDLLPKALLQLSENNQIYVTAKFAKMEIEHGDLEKGRSMFLTVCLQRPKRTDLWLLYANSLYKMKQFQLACDALRTALQSKNLTPKDLKPLLKRLVEIETLQGTPESLEKVKSEAAGYLSAAV